MKIKKLMKLLISTVILIPLLFISCNNSSKKITISDDTQSEVALEESEVLAAVTNGEKLIDEGNFEEAKEEFIKAITLDKTNKEMYLRIKDKYLSVDKTDEAYYFIKTAVTNNVDVENMKSVLKDISNKFEKINIQTSVYQNSNYSLPQQVITMISGEQVNIPVSWENQVVDTANVGTFTFQGYNEDYGRNITVELTVLENVYDKQIGSIKKIYTSNGKTYIDVDLVEFYTGTEAVTKALEDNAPVDYTEDNIPYRIPGYYIRNNYSTITTYEVSNSSNFKLLKHDLQRLGYDIDTSGTFDITIDASLDDFKSYIELANKNYEISFTDFGAPYPHRETLCWIELKNNSAYSIYRKYTS